MAEKFKFVLAAATWEELFVCLSLPSLPMMPSNSDLKSAPHWVQNMIGSGPNLLIPKCVPSKTGVWLSLSQ